MVKWFILIIVLVFDPLSICLVLAYNFLVKRENKPEEPKIFTLYEEKPIDEPVVETPTEILTNVKIRPWQDETVEIDEPKVMSQELINKLNSEDPYPQYMTKEETEAVLERWWRKRNGIDTNLF